MQLPTTAMGCVPLRGSSFYFDLVTERIFLQGRPTTTTYSGFCTIPTTHVRTAHRQKCHGKTQRPLEAVFPDIERLKAAMQCTTREGADDRANLC